MDISELSNLVEEEVLKQLPEEALDQLLELSEDDSDYEIAVNAILKRYGVDPVEIAKNVTEKEEEE